MFCPNTKCGNPLSISTECEACGWKAKRVYSAAPQADKATVVSERVTKYKANRAAIAAHDQKMADTAIADVVSVEVVEKSTYRSNGVVHVKTACGKTYALKDSLPGLSDSRLAEICEKPSTEHFELIDEEAEEAEVVEAVEEVTITRDDSRYTIEGARFRAWVGAMDMGGWTGDSVEDFKEAILDELIYAVHEDEAWLSMESIIIEEVAYIDDYGDSVWVSI